MMASAVRSAITEYPAWRHASVTAQVIEEKEVVPLGKSSIASVGRTRSPTVGIPLCFGWYPSTDAASRMRARVLFETGRFREYAWEAVETETPASSATSL